MANIRELALGQDILLTNKLETPFLPISGGSGEGKEKPSLKTHDRVLALIRDSRKGLSPKTYITPDINGMAEKLNVKGPEVVRHHVKKIKKEYPSLKILQEKERLARLEKTTLRYIPKRTKPDPEKIARKINQSEQFITDSEEIGRTIKRLVEKGMISKGEKKRQAEERRKEIVRLVKEKGITDYKTLATETGAKNISQISYDMQILYRRGWLERIRKRKIPKELEKLDDLVVRYLGSGTRKEITQRINNDLDKDYTVFDINNRITSLKRRGIIVIGDHEKEREELKTKVMDLRKKRSEKTGKYLTTKEIAEILGIPDKPRRVTKCVTELLKEEKIKRRK